jgi:uncharacterized protein (DUF433 family)
MDRIRWQDRVTIAPDLHHGEPCIRGTRVRVAVVIGSLAEGMSEKEIREAYPQLAAEDIRAALAYAADAVGVEALAPIELRRALAGQGRRGPTGGGRGGARRGWSRHGQGP